MNLLSLYSLASGLKIGKQHLIESFFPSEADKYITIQAGSGMPAKNYPHYNEVIKLIEPMLGAAGIKILQLGGKDDCQLSGCQRLLGQTTLHQTNYLLARSLCHVGNDSWMAHRAGYLGVPMVISYGSTSPKNHGPHHQTDKTILIESHRFGRRPTFAREEFPSTIAVITPEEIANAILSVLDLSQVTRKSLFIGQLYHQSIIELIPNVIIDPRMPLNVAPIIRMDYHYDVKNFTGNLQARKCSVILDKEIDIKVLAGLKPNIVSLRVEIDKISPDWIKQMRKLGIPCAFVCLESDEKKVEKMRLDYYDACLFDRFQAPTVEDFKEAVKAFTQEEFDKEIKLDTLSFKVNKYLLSEGKVYLSEAHWRAGINTPNTEQNTGKVIDSPQFFIDKEHYYIFQENSTNS